eukprot:TRINITY_DN29164_c0_g1_i1.p2 TRINITY_DN29164_c0_g1~~TRINITY_DN29164_c0_g1_i1.p2  ORF type:complete len:172 (+),score=12.65 TRINITY_DN29164_c0_g1_i1:446-961(+)
MVYVFGAVSQDTWHELAPTRNRVSHLQGTVYANSGIAVDLPTVYPSNGRLPNLRHTSLLSSRQGAAQGSGMIQTRAVEQFAQDAVIVASRKSVPFSVAVLMCVDDTCIVALVYCDIELCIAWHQMFPVFCLQHSRSFLRRTLYTSICDAAGVSEASHGNRDGVSEGDEAEC